MSRYARKEVKQELKYLLWASLYQVAFMKKGAHHVVKETVDYAKMEHGVHAAGFVNAVLRNFIRERKKGVIPLPGSTPSGHPGSDRQLAEASSFPEWLVRRWRKQVGPEHIEKLLHALNTPPQFTLRVDESRISKDDAVRKLQGLNLKVWAGRFVQSALCVDRLMPLLHDSLFGDRTFAIQDEASQLAVQALRLAPGSIVLDACSGMGTKTAHMLHITPGIFVAAMDTNVRRLHLVDRRAAVLRGDVLRSPFKARVFDAILLDPPCSSLGIVRKHPEIKWRRTEDDITAFGLQQYNMLVAVWDSLKVGGHLVYSVCSFEPQETIHVIERFKQVEKFTLENPLPFLFNKEYFVSLPHETEIDGFFIARLKKL